MWTIVAKRLLSSWSTSMLMTEPLAYSQWLMLGLDEQRENRNPNGADHEPNVPQIYTTYPYATAVEEYWDEHPVSLGRI
jgi:hypothetical protein